MRNIIRCLHPLMLFSKPPYATMFFVLDFIVHYLLHVSYMYVTSCYTADSTDIHSGHPNISGPKHVVSSAQ
jgi:hypothetical protein